MSYHPHRDFEQMRSDLGSMLVYTTSQFARQHGLQPVQEKSLTQMTQSVDGVAGELLMFGCDAWPDCARSEADVAPADRAPAVSYWGWTLFALFASTLFTLTFHYAFPETPPPSFIYAFTITAVAVMLGSTYGVALALLVPLATRFVVFQLSLVPPATLPSIGFQAVTEVFYVAVAILFPWFILKAISFRSKMGTPFGADPLKRKLGLV